MTTIVLNVSSLLLGLAAWGFGLNALRRQRMSLLSFVLCLLSMVLQFAELTHRAAVGDIHAILDTVCAVFWAAATLAAGTVFLNALAHFQGRKSEKDGESRPFRLLQNLNLKKNCHCEGKALHGSDRLFDTIKPPGSKEPGGAIQLLCPDIPFRSVCRVQGL